MVPSPLDTTATADRLRRLGEAGLLAPPALRRALEVAAGSPPPAAWARFLSRGLALLGALLVAAGVIDFFAFNWAALPAWAKLGGLQALVALAALGALWPAGSRVVRQVSLLLASLLVGPLLGVYGQTYQTGADPYELFLGWGALVLPWALVARLPSLWLLEVILADVGLALFLYQTGSIESDQELVTAVAVGAVHAAAVVAYEWLAARRVEGAQARWWPRLLTASGLTMLLAPTLLLAVTRKGNFFFSSTSAVEVLGALMLAAALAAIGLFYRGKRRDLFQIVAACGSLIAVVTTTLGTVLIADLKLREVGVLMTGLAVVAQVGMAVTWLRRLGASEEAA